MYSWKKLWLFVALPRSELRTSFFFFLSFKSQDFTVCFYFILDAFVLDFIIHLEDFPSAPFLLMSFSQIEF